jgi:hypothetical protein
MVVDVFVPIQDGQCRGLVQFVDERGHASIPDSRSMTEVRGVFLVYTFRTQCLDAVSSSLHRGRKRTKRILSRTKYVKRR